MVFGEQAHLPPQPLYLGGVPEGSGVLKGRGCREVRPLRDQAGQPVLPLAAFERAQAQVESPGFQLSTVFRFHDPSNRPECK